MKFDKNFDVVSNTEEDFFLKGSKDFKKEEETSQTQSNGNSAKGKNDKTKKQGLSLDELIARRKTTNKEKQYGFSMRMNEDLYKALCQIADDDKKKLNTVVRELIEKEYKRRGY